MVLASRVTRHSYHFYLASFFSISFASILTVLIRPVIFIWFCVYLFCALWIRTTFALLFIQCKFGRIGRENILLPLGMVNRIYPSISYHFFKIYIDISIWFVCSLIFMEILPLVIIRFHAIMLKVIPVDKKLSWYFLLKAS